MELFANDSTTTLNGAINNSVTTITVTSSSSFPTTGNFRIKIDSEIMKVTAVTGNDFTVVRGQEGTSAASHSNGATVDGILTKDSLKEFRSDNVPFLAYSSLPAAGIPGRIFVPNDGGINFVDDGANWLGFNESPPLAPIDDSSFSWVNQASAVKTVTGSYVSVHRVGGTTNHYNFRVKSAPSPPYVITIKAKIHVTTANTFAGAFFGFRQSSDGKCHGILAGWNSGALTYFSTRLDDETSFNGNYTSFAYLQAKPDIAEWYRIADNNTNRQLWYSHDGVLWYFLDEQSRTNFMTPDQVIFGIRQDDNSGTMTGVTIKSWLES